MARPATHPIKKVVGFDPELMERVRNYRFDHRISTENEAIRQLIEAGLGKAKPGEPASSSGSGGANVEPMESSASERLCCDRRGGMG